MPRVIRKVGKRLVVKKTAAKKKVARHAKPATILVNGFNYKDVEFPQYSTHAAFVRGQKKAYKRLAEIKERELTSVGTILKRLAANER